MSAEDLERYETEMELQLYREYRDVVRTFSYIVETERRFYLANEVTVTPRETAGDVYFELQLRDAWVWDMYRPARFVQHVRVLTFRDVNVEELAHDDETPPFLTEVDSGDAGS
jgi:predicted glutamine amidotransferase